MSSWRINVIKRDRSGTVIANTDATGAMVVRASKGTLKPFYISTGNEQKIINLCGYPSASYPDVQEAIEYNKVGPLWISAPSPATDTMGGVAILDSGVVPLTTGVTEAGFDSYTFADVDHVLTELIGTGDTIETTFSTTLDFSVDDPTTNLDATVDGASISLTVTGAGPEYSITGSGLGSGTYNSSTRLLSLTFTSAPAAVAINAVYTHAFEPYMVLLSKSPMTDDLAVSVEWDNNNSWWDFDLYQKSPFTNEYILQSEFSGSDDPNAVDGFGASVYIENKIEENDFVRVIVNSDDKTAPTTAFNDSTQTEFAGGVRSTTSTTEISLGWNEFQDEDSYNASIFMDATSDSAVPALFDSLSKNYQKYKSYILTLPMGETPTEAIATKDGYSLNNSDIAIYYQHAKVNDVYNNSSFWTSLAGRIGQKYALMDDIYNAGAPYFVDQNNHGGSLGSGIIELERTLSEDELQTLDTAGVNPITFKPAFGVMIEGQKTAQTPTITSDYSYVAHARLFNYIVSNIITGVLIPQIGKLNDENHRLLAKTNADAIVNPIVADGYLRDALTICDTSNNTDEVLARREFLLDVVVQVTPYSERVTLRFTNIAQTTTVAQVVG